MANDDCNSNIDQSGMDFSRRFINANIALQAAVEANNVEMVKSLLQQGCDINGEANGKKTLLHIAAAQNNVEIAQCLIDDGSARINVKDYDGNTPLHIAARQEDGMEMVMLLMDVGADAYARNDQGLTPIDEAATPEIQDVLINPHAYEWVINTPIKSNSNNGYGGASADDDAFMRTVIQAVQTKSYDCVKDMLRNGANPNVKDSLNLTPLHLAVMNNDNQLAKLLLENNADANAKEGIGTTPLHMAAQQDISMIELLLDNGADPFIRDEMQLQPIDYVDRNDPSGIDKCELFLKAAIRKKGAPANTPANNAVKKPAFQEWSSKEKYLDLSPKEISENLMTEKGLKEAARLFGDDFSPLVNKMGAANAMRTFVHIYKRLSPAQKDSYSKAAASLRDREGKKSASSRLNRERD